MTAYRRKQTRWQMKKNPSLSRINRKKILDLGCGNQKGLNCYYEGDITGIDQDKNSQADIIWDLEKFPYPFADNEFDYIYSHHCLEHLEDTPKVIEELCRITKPHGKIDIIVPYGANSSALNNVTHKKFFSVEAITGVAYYNHKIKVLKMKYNYLNKGLPAKQSWKGKLFRKIFKPMEWFINKHPTFYGKFLRHYIGDAEEIEWELEVVK